VSIFKTIFLDRDSRSINADKNVLYLLLFKIVNISISFLYVPLLINSLNTYRYGIWLTITSIVTWMNLFDIGLGNGLRNKLSEAIAKDNIKEAKYLISTAYASIAGLSLFLCILFTIITIKLDWSNILNVPETMKYEVTRLVNLVILLFIAQLTLSIINSILLAFQKPAYSAFITTFGQILSFGLVAFFVLVLKFSSLFILGLLISISPLIVLFLFTVYVFSTKYKLYVPSLNYIKISYLKNILSLGLKFFVLQIITIVLFQTSNIIIAHKVGQVGVTEYNIIYKYMGIIYMVFSIIVMPYWSATTDAYFRGDMVWIKQSKRKLNFIWLLLSFVGLILLFISGFAFKVWIGKAISVNYTTLGLALIYFVLLMKYNANVFILNGIGKIYAQMIITSIIAIQYIPTTIFLSVHFGLNGVFISLIITAAINALWSSVQFHKIVENRAKGIWNK